MEEVQQTNLKKKFYKKWWFWTLIVVTILIVIIIACSSGSTYPTDLKDLPESEYKSECQVFSYEDIARNPNDYNKELAKFTGEIIQIVRDGNALQMRVNVTLKGEAPLTYYADTMYVFYTIKDNVNVLENDIITMYGELRGTKQYISVTNQQVTIPQIYVKFIEIN